MMTDINMPSRSTLARLTSLLLLSGITLMPQLQSCQHNKENSNNHANAQRLFEKSVEKIKVYTDSIMNVNDSASLRRMSEGINDVLVKVVYEFPPNTDLDLTEEENDSIIHMLDRLSVLIKEKKLSVIKTNEVSDSIALQTEDNEEDNLK